MKDFRMIKVLAQTWLVEAKELNYKSKKTYDNITTDSDDATIYSSYEDGAAATYLNGCANQLLELFNNQISTSITVSIEVLYGRQVIRPYCNVAQTFAQLLNQTTLTAKNIDIIKSLGYEVKVLQPKFTLD